ncbi:transferases, transferring hexosyl groups [Actinidia rufa]|uniref:GPI mannosyltransferase 2 n=1 Tax=Actinidia rufa TaxID=165716 RepID=A0A7J0H561_9ERIC|nr:transferases, transferring hexosyl groups [Actinidia rufa]
MAGSESSIEIHHTRIVLRSAIASRLLLVALIVLWRSLLNPYDTSAAINPSCLSSSSSKSPSVLFPRIASAIEDTVVWDGVYFVRIAQCGYEYEQSYAFFPLFPLSMALLSRTVFAVLIPVIGYRAVLALSGYVISNLAFVLAATCLYRLSVIILKDRETALRASILFCFNPASIFYSSIYTESLYSLSSIGGVYQLMSGANNLATLMFSLSGAARSNGVINAAEHKNSASLGADTRAKGGYVLKEHSSRIQEGGNSVLVCKSTSLLVRLTFNGVSQNWQEMGICDMGILCSLHILLGSLLFSNFYPFT